jgi:hypothetical protein
VRILAAGLHVQGADDGKENDARAQKSYKTADFPGRQDQYLKACFAKWWPRVQTC